MITRPANDDYNKRAGLNSLSRGSSHAPQFDRLRTEAYEDRISSDPAEEVGHDWQHRTLSLLLDRVPGLAYRCRPDKERTMEYISEGCFGLTGYHPSDLIDNHAISYGQLVLPDDRIGMWDHLDGALREGNYYDLSYRIRTLAGQEKWIREIGRVLDHPEGKLVALEGLLLDITDGKYKEKQIQKQVERFEALRKIDTAIAGSFDLRVTLDILLDQVITHLQVDAADILLYEDSSQMLEFVAGRGFKATALQHMRLRLGEGYAGVAALEHHAVRVDNLSTSPDELKRTPQIVNEGFKAYYGIPLIAKGLVKGILEIYHRSAFEPSIEWVEFVDALAGQAAIAIENSTLFAELQRSNVELTLAYDATLEGWSKALELRHQGMSGHTQRVTDLTLQLAQLMGLNSSQLVHIRRGALLHDIGEMGIPDRIFLKPGPLNDEEWNVVRQHPVNAYKLLSSISNLRPSLDIPYCHHEKWDGTGYPRGLQMEQIPLVARIFAVVDVWDALLSERPYRNAWPRHQVIQYLREQSGNSFDPRVVDIFLNEIVGRAIISV